MSVLRSLGMGKDKEGYSCEVLVDDSTGQQYLAYSLETHQQRIRDRDALREDSTRQLQAVSDANTARLAESA